MVVCWLVVKTILREYPMKGISLGDLLGLVDKQPVAPTNCWILLVECFRDPILIQNHSQYLQDAPQKQKNEILRPEVQQADSQIVPHLPFGALGKGKSNIE